MSEVYLYGGSISGTVFSGASVTAPFGAILAPDGGSMRSPLSFSKRGSSEVIGTDIPGKDEGLDPGAVGRTTPPLCFFLLSDIIITPFDDSIGDIGFIIHFHPRYVKDIPQHRA